MYYIHMQKTTIELPDITINQIEDIKQALGESTTKAVIVRAVDWLWLVVVVSGWYKKIGGGKDEN